MPTAGWSCASRASVGKPTRSADIRGRPEMAQRVLPHFPDNPGAEVSRAVDTAGGTDRLPASSWNDVSALPPASTKAPTAMRSRGTNPRRVHQRKFALGVPAFAKAMARLP